MNENKEKTNNKTELLVDLISKKTATRVIAQLNLNKTKQNIDNKALNTMYLKKTEKILNNHLNLKKIIEDNFSEEDKIFDYSQELKESKDSSIAFYNYTQKILNNYVSELSNSNDTLDEIKKAIVIDIYQGGVKKREFIKKYSYFFTSATENKGNMEKLHRTIMKVVEDISRKIYGVNTY